MSMDGEVEQAIRRMHCAKRGEQPPHPCAGVVTITAKGVELSCVLCGDETIDRLDRRYTPAQYERARHILEAAGLSWDVLGIDAQLAVMVEVAKPWPDGPPR